MEIVKFGGFFFKAVGRFTSRSRIELVLFMTCRQVKLSLQAQSMTKLVIGWS